MNVYFHSALIIIVLSILPSSSGEDNVVCRDENNNPVDWFYLYKLPKNRFKTDNPLIENGLGYLYITPETVERGWTLSKKSINDTNSIPGLTLAALYDKNENIIRIIYNDQPEEGYTKKSSTNNKTIDDKKKKKSFGSTSGGHTKGVILGNEHSGIWLIHSVPKYPPIPANINSVNDVNYSYPKTGTVYGQSFLCLSLNLNQMQNVGQQLKYNEPKITHSYLPEHMEMKYSNLIDVINNKTVKNAPWYNIEAITTKGGMSFVSFAKSGHFDDDLYESLVAPALKKNLLVETWIKGPGVLTSNCSRKFSVNNVEKVAFDNVKMAFSSYNDHSKWAISNGPEDNSNSWVCIGDINRARSQELRGGGTVCTQNILLWKHYTSIVNSIMPCPKPTNDIENCNNN